MPIIVNGGGGGSTSVLVQKKYYLTSSLDSTSSVILLDDSIPEATEGKQFLSLSITPSNASNILYIHVSLQTNQNPPAITTVALFKNEDTYAIASTFGTSTGGISAPLTLDFQMVAGSTSPITFTVRAGLDRPGTLYVNGTGAGRAYGGTCISSITIEEVI